MNRKGRRLKRYLGLRREAGISWRGGIEDILPGQISGWVVAKGLHLHEVRLLVGPHLIGQALINQRREDVCQTLGVEGDFGFQLQLSGDLPAVVFAQAPRLLACSADGKSTAELAFIPDRKCTSERLAAVLAPELRGVVGHLDGLSPEGDAVQGWAYRQGQTSQKPIQIWLQAEGQAPLAVRCDFYRPGMVAQGHPESCGFRIALEQLPAAWAGMALRATFDAAGALPLPGAMDCVVSALVSGGNPLANLAVRGAAADATSDLQPAWQALEQYKQFLDGLEAQVQRTEALRSQRPRRKRDHLLSWLVRLAG